MILWEQIQGVGNMSPTRYHFASNIKIDSDSMNYRILGIVLGHTQPLRPFCSQQYKMLSYFLKIVSAKVVACGLVLKIVSEPLCQLDNKWASQNLRMTNIKFVTRRIL